MQRFQGWRSCRQDSRKRVRVSSLPGNQQGDAGKGRSEGRLLVGGAELRTCPMTPPFFRVVRQVPVIVSDTADYDIDLFGTGCFGISLEAAD